MEVKHEIDDPPEAEAWTRSKWKRFLDKQKPDYERIRARELAYDKEKKRRRDGRRALEAQGIHEIPEDLRRRGPMASSPSPSMRGA